MARARADKKRDKDGSAQPSLPGTREPDARDPAAPSTMRILPMQLQVGDRLSEETGEWEVAARPHTTAGGKVAHVRVRRVDQPTIVEERMWGAHERVEVTRG
jgi:hypothetical protein